jgi:para-nitrobenzyl esterase
MILPVMFTQGQSLQVKTANGILEGKETVGIRSFKGVPFAAPPVGDLRWKEPQPVKNWEGVRKAVNFGPRAMQRPLFSDMQFRSDGMSEDCLYLNVWTPARSDKEKLPVLVYFYGGGLMAGDGSELRYDGESMSRNGIVVITVNYRLNIFGFFNHPALSAESPHRASGNYGLLDQAAALQWVKKNIAAFGGDPNHITIAGESAGSFSVSVQMASPLSKDLIAGAIGESGAIMGKNATMPLAEAEQKGVQFADKMGVSSLKALRALPADKLLEATSEDWYSRFPVTLDGYFLTERPQDTYQKGEQAHIPLLAGWNSAEMDYHALLDKDAPTVTNYEKAVRRIFGDSSVYIFKQYPAPTDNDVKQAATDLASDRFIAFGTWKWIDLHAKTSGKPVFRYLFSHPRPAEKVEKTNSKAQPKEAPMGASHSAEIEYALGNLVTNRVYNWGPDDRKVSAEMEQMFARFIKTGSPNSKGLPEWPPVKPGIATPFMNIDVHSQAETEQHRERYVFINEWSLM